MQKAMIASSPYSSECIDYQLNYRMVKTDAKLLKVLFEYNGFRATESSNTWNILWSSVSPPLAVYDSMTEHQKINHFPQSNELTRKDRLCFNLVQMQKVYGKETFSIIPETYILP